MEWAAAEGSEDPEEWECVACDKIFRSEAAWDSHERSKKHMKAVERLRSEMEEDEEAFGLGTSEVQNDEDRNDEPTTVEITAGVTDGSDLPSLIAEPEDAITASQDLVSVVNTDDANTEIDDTEEMFPTKIKRAKKKGKPSNPDSYEPLTKSEKKLRNLPDIALSPEYPPIVTSPETEATTDGSRTELSKRQKRHQRGAKQGLMDQVSRQVSLHLSRVY